jgi:hypothetical protein
VEVTVMARRLGVWMALGALCVGGMASSPAAHATTVVALDVEEQALLSDAIVHARVLGADPVRTPTAAYIDTRLQITEVLAGTAPAEITIRQMGGVHDGVRVHVPGDATLVPGGQVVAFVREVEGRWYLTAMGQSVWTVTDPAASDAPVERDLKGVAVLERALDGSLREPTQSLPVYTTLSELRTAVSGLQVAP